VCATGRVSVFWGRLPHLVDTSCWFQWNTWLEELRCLGQHGREGRNKRSGGRKETRTESDSADGEGGGKEPATEEGAARERTAEEDGASPRARVQIESAGSDARAGAGDGKSRERAEEKRATSPSADAEARVATKQGKRDAEEVTAEPKEKSEREPPARDPAQDVLEWSEEGGEPRG
jgi:hypothetical protein